MSDTDTIDLGPTLSPEETAFFESGGNTEIPSADKGGDGTGDTAGADKTGEGKDGENKEKVEQMVSLAALHEERTKRKERDAENRKLNEQLAELRGKFSIIDKLSVPAQEEQQPLTAEADIFGFAKKTGETVEQLAKRLDDKEAADKAANEQTALISTYTRDAAAFEAKTPDYRAAYNHLLNSRAQELIALGYDDAAALEQALQNEEIQIAQIAFARKKSPAEIIYGLAQQRGYVKADPNKKNVAADKLDTIERGQNANKTLSNTGGNSGDADMTGEMLLKLPNDEFEAWCNKFPAKAKRLMGG